MPVSEQIDGFERLLGSSQENRSYGRPMRGQAFVGVPFVIGPIPASVGETMVFRSAPALTSIVLVVSLVLLAAGTSGYAQQTTGQLLILSDSIPSPPPPRRWWHV